MTTATKTAALTVSVLRNPKWDCTMNGVTVRFTDLAIVGVVDKREDLGARAVDPLSTSLRLPPWNGRTEGEDYASAPVALVVRRPFGTEPVFHLEPVEQTENGGWQLVSDAHGPTMAGGNYAATSDSRFGELIRSYGGPSYVALSVHDRCESWDQYRALSSD